jgi:hypothetical protein
MKECGNSKIHISSNFILSVSLLIMFDALLLRPSLHCNTSLHCTTLIDTSLPLIYTSLLSHLAVRIYISNFNSTEDSLGFQHNIQKRNSHVTITRPCFKPPNSLDNFKGCEGKKGRRRKLLV